MPSRAKDHQHQAEGGNELAAHLGHAFAHMLGRRERRQMGLSKILCTRVPGRRLSIYPETP